MHCWYGFWSSNLCLYLIAHLARRLKGLQSLDKSRRSDSVDLCARSAGRGIPENKQLVPRLRIASSTRAWSGFARTPRSLSAGFSLLPLRGRKLAYASSALSRPKAAHLLSEQTKPPSMTKVKVRVRRNC